MNPTPSREVTKKTKKKKKEDKHNKDNGIRFHRFLNLSVFAP